MSWSPDGTKILLGKSFLDHTQPNSIFVKDLKSDAPASLTSTKPADWADGVPIWGKDGKEILFFSRKAATVYPDLYVMDVAGTQRRKLDIFNAAKPFKIYGIYSGGWAGAVARDVGVQLSWSSDRSRFAYLDFVKPNVSLNVFVYDFATGVDQISQTTGITGAFQLRPDGTSVAYSVAGGVWVANVASKKETKVLDHPALKISYAPYGNRLFLISLDKLVLVDLSTYTTKPLEIPDVKRVENATWLPDGSTIIVLADDHVYSLDVNTSRSTQWFIDFVPHKWVLGNTDSRSHVLKPNLLIPAQY